MIKTTSKLSLDNAEIEVTREEGKNVTYRIWIKNLPAQEIAGVTLDADEMYSVVNFLSRITTWIPTMLSKPGQSYPVKPRSHGKDGLLCLKPNKN